MSLQHYLHQQPALQLLYGIELVHLTLFLHMRGLPRKLNKKVDILYVIQFK
jgi:hypothetical protein